MVVSNVRWVAPFVSGNAGTFRIEDLEPRQLLSGSPSVLNHHHSAPPAAPTQFTAAAASTTQVKLNWLDNATNETSYTIFRKTSKHGKYVQLVTLPANSTYFKNKGLSAGQNYWYEVEAVNAAGASALAVAYTATPGVTATPTPTPTPTSGAIALDRSFNSTGEVIDTDLKGAQRVGVQPGGKIVVLAQMVNGGQEVLRRYNTDGTLDASFGTGGTVGIVAPYAFTTGRGMVIESDGKIIVGGGGGVPPSSNPFSRAYVFRFNADGSPDTTFGSGGVAQGTSSFSHSREFADIAVAPDGKIALGGSDGDSFFAERFTASGTLDASFGPSGEVVISQVGSSAVNTAAVAAVAIDPNDDSVVLVGSNVGSSQFLQDHVFSLQGRRITSPSAITSFSLNDNGAHQYYPRDVTVQPDGKIVVASSYGGSEADLYRFNTDGSRDTSFTGNALGSPAGGNGAYGYEGLLRLSNGAFLAGGFTFTSSSNSDFVLTRISTSGAIDPSAGGTKGVVTTDLGATDETISSLAVEPDGSIIAAGLSGGNLVVLRYRAT